MPILTIEYPSSPHVRAADALRQLGPSLPVLVRLPQIPGAPGPSEDQPPQPRQVSALIDTGAFDSCIDEQVASSLQLPIIDRQRVSGVAGRREHNVFLAQVDVPAVNKSRRGRFVGVTLGPQHHAILGREFLHGMLLIYDGENGRVQLCV